MEYGVWKLGLEVGVDVQSLECFLDVFEVFRSVFGVSLCVLLVCFLECFVLNVLGVLFGGFSECVWDFVGSVMERDKKLGE